MRSSPKAIASNHNAIARADINNVITRNLNGVADIGNAIAYKAIAMDRNATARPYILNATLTLAMRSLAILIERLTLAMRFHFSRYHFGVREFVREDFV